MISRLAQSLSSNFQIFKKINTQLKYKLKQNGKNNWN